MTRLKSNKNLTKEELINLLLKSKIRGLTKTELRTGYTKAQLINIAKRLRLY